ncbi:MAG TPA: zinc ribbon domain-containing protein [Dehalococcoidia bacterium]
MPLYEYRCGSCGRTSTLFTRRIGAPVDARCQHCGGTEMTRLVSPFAQHKTLKTKLEELDPKYDKMVEAADNLKGDDPLNRLLQEPRNQEWARTNE